MNSSVISMLKKPSLEFSFIFELIYSKGTLIIITKKYMSSKVNPKVYMDIQIGSKGAGRMIF